MIRRVLVLCAMLGCSRPEGQPIRVVIPEGATMRVAAESLASAQLISTSTGFRIYGRVSGNDRALKPGTYLMKRGTPWPEIMRALIGGRGLVRSVTIPEGLALAQIAALVGKALDAPPDSVLAAARDTALRRRLNVPTPTLEGYLFPDTYAFPEGTAPARAVSEMVRRFEREWDPKWDARLAELAMSRNQIMALASIIEEEAKLPRERPIISAVYHNRLRIGMPLQADPTVQYAHGIHAERVMLRDLEIDSPYNTYKYPGLPPGPISSPGGESIRAALFPATADHLYFVAHPDGHHEFTRSLEQHNAVRARLRSANPPAGSARAAARPQAAARKP
ncbi:MAG TPA: endolytic transglycosylase MltG [Gemmatimonadaceae bacterium]|nr:endolytic transglycosylase MltG [Gemmatimonadaceae bacterium]